MRKYYFLFYVVLIVLFNPAYSFASSWLDVVDWISANPEPAGSKYWVEDIITPEGAGMRVWSRAGGSSLLSYERKKTRSTQLPPPDGGAGIHDGVWLCDGSLTQQNGIMGWWVTQGGSDLLYCDGSSVDGAWSPSGSRYINLGSNQTCYWDDQFKNSCAPLDTLVHEVLGIVDDCSYSGVTPEGGLLYKNTINIEGGSAGVHSCYSCIPSGTVPRDDLYTSDGLFDSCYYERVTGDFADVSYSVTIIPSSGSGANDPVNSVPPIPGGPTGDAGTTTTETTTTDASGETYTTTSETTTGEDGTVTTTTTETLTGCLDENLDGLSDINGRACGSSSTTTETASTTKEIGKPVNPYGSFSGETFSSVYAQHSAVWQTSEVVGLISSMEVTLPSALPCFDFNLGSWGNVGSFCLSTYAWIFDMIYYLNIFACVLLSRFIIFGGR